MNEAVRLEAAGDLQGAANACRQAIPLDPPEDGPVRLLDRLLFKSSPAERRAVWEAALSDNPDNPRVAVFCGIARVAAGDIDGARHLFRAWPSSSNWAGSLRGLLSDETVRLEAAGNLQGALIACRGAILLDPGDDGPVRLLERLLSKIGPTERQAVWEAALSENPDNPHVAARCGVARAAVGDWAGSRLLFRTLPKSLNYGAAFQRVAMDTGVRLETAGDLSGAVTAYREAIPFDTQNITPVHSLENALRRSSPAERRAVWESVLSENPDNLHVAAFCGLARASAGDLAGAKQILGVLPENSNSAPSFQSRFVEEGARLEAAGELSHAIDAYREAIPLYPQNREPVRRLENALFKRSPAERRAVWEAVFSDNPENPHVAVLCGIARAATGDTAGARSAFDIIGRFAPEEWHYCELAGDALAAAGAWGDAASAYRCAVTLNPGLRHQPMFIAEGCRKELEGDIPGAMDAFEKAILADPANTEPYWRLDTACPKTDPGVSLGLWRKIRESIPENAVIDVLYGESLAAAGSSDVARVMVEAALRLGGNDCNVLVHAGSAWEVMRDWAQAAACYERALAINPGLEYLHLRLGDMHERAAMPR